MKHPSIKRSWWLRTIFYIIWGLIIAFVLWQWIIVPLYQTHKLNVKDALYQASSQYENALLARTELNQKIQKASESQKSTLSQEAPGLEGKVAERSKELDTAFAKIKKTYPHEPLIKERIQAFQAWRDQSQKQILTSTNDQWDLTFLKLQIGINKAISKAETGYEDSTEAENQKIMSLVPTAEQALKKHPNDKKLCTVMQQPLNSLNPNFHLTAQQIAFFNVGDQYCSRYYADPVAWGEWGVKARVITPTPSFQERPAYSPEKTTEEKGIGNTEELSLNQKYNSLPYPQYYNQYVLPLIPKAIQTLKNPKENLNMCLTASVSAGPRNPEQDAARAAFTQVGKQYCPPQTTERGFNSTGVVCLTYCNALCSEGMICDCVERCKKTSGILFKGSSY